jgi:tripartite-type tricarboxylate transporter receptor subunit TctC
LHSQHIDIVTDFVVSVKPRIDANVFRPILTVEQRRNPDFADLPSMTEIGYKNYVFYNWFVLTLSASVPPSDIDLVQQAMQAMIQRPDVRKQLQEAGLQGIGNRMASNFLTMQHTQLEKIVKQINLDAK